MADKNGAPTFDIPTECIGGVVVNEGPDFEVQVQKVPVPEIGTSSSLIHGGGGHHQKTIHMLISHASQGRTMSSSS